MLKHLLKTPAEMLQGYLFIYFLLNNQLINTQTQIFSI